MIALLLDTETTGLFTHPTAKIEKQPHIVEFYGCLYDLQNEKLIDEYDTLIKPPIKIPPEASKKTHIYDETVADSQPFVAHAGNIGALIERAPLVIAHNASYDQEILDVEFRRLGVTLKWPKLLCTVEATVHLKGYRLSLTALHETLFGKTFPEAHRAKQDVEALTRCCVGLYKRGEL
jgi:DNA polymerase III epsilon subunit-like protein